MTEFILNGPFDLVLKVHATDGEQMATATLDLPRGQFTDKDKIKTAVEEVEAQVKEKFGEAWRLCTKREFFHMLTSELIGSTEGFAMPGGKEWDE